MSTETELAKPSLTIQATDEKLIKMSYGLLMDLQRLLPNPTAALELTMTDPFTQDYVVRRVMTDSKATITDQETLIKSEDLDLTPEQIEKILGWVVQHILHFFAQRVTSLAAAGERFKTALPSLFTSGFADSPLTTPSAGPSE